jgi:predicted HicB family RNase H-like nuclease
MSSTMTYKGQTARIEFDERDNILVGRLVGITDLVSFHAESVTELRAVFEEAVDDYIETCEKLGKTPQKTASGKLMLRVPPEVHTAALTAAEAAGTSLNQWATHVLGEAAGLHRHG